MESLEEVGYWIFACFVMIVAVAVGLATLFSYVVNQVEVFLKLINEVRASLARNEVAAASLSRQIQEQATGPKTYMRPRKNRVVSLSEGELARREDKKTKD